MVRLLVQERPKSNPGKLRRKRGIQTAKFALSVTKKLMMIQKTLFSVKVSARGGFTECVHAGTSQKIFQTLDNPDTQFLCHYCHNNKQNLVIEDLKQVTLLESALSTLWSKLPSEAPVLKTSSKPPSGTMLKSPQLAPHNSTPTRQLTPVSQT